MYVLRSPITKISISKICPLCRLPQISSTALQSTFNRLQSTNVNTSIVRLKPKKKKKTNTGDYSEVIQVVETLGNNIKESRTVIKKSSTSEILNDLKNISRQKFGEQALCPVTISNQTSANVNTIVNTQLASHSSHVKRATATKTAKKVSKEKCSLQKDYLAEYHESPEARNTVDVNTMVGNPNRATSVELHDAAFVNNFTPDHFLNLKNDHTPTLESFNQDLDKESATFLPSLDLDVEDIDDAHKTSSDQNKITKNDRLSKKRKPLNIQDQENTFKIKRKDQEKSRKDLHLNLSLLAFLDVCLNSDMLSLAHKTLMCYQGKDVRLFNIVLHGHAQKGNWTKVIELLKALQKGNIKPNLQTYAACLECISNQPSKNKKIIRNVLQDVHKHGLDIAKLDHECTFINDQRERVIKMVQLVHPNFKPTLRENLRHYSCNLLTRLNEEPPEDYFYNPSGGAVTHKQLLAGLKDQMQMEVLNKVLVPSIEKQENQVDRRLEKTRSVLRDCEENWRTILHRAFEANVSNLKSVQDAKYGKSITLYPFLMSISANDFVNIMIQEIQHLAESSETYSLPRHTLHFLIGSKVMNSYMTDRKQKQGYISKIESLYGEYCKYYINPKLTSQYTPREYWQKLCCENVEGPSTDADEWSWPYFITIGIGKILYDIIIKTVMISSNVLKSKAIKGFEIPAFYNIFRNNATCITEEIKPHPKLVQIYQSEMKDMLTFEGTVLPSLVPPLPWTSIRSGGYLLSSAKFMRLAGVAAPQKITLEQTPSQQLFPIYDSLNQLGECPWKINKPILDVIIEVFNNKGDSTLDIPSPISECTPLPSINCNMSKIERAKAHKERISLIKKRTEMHSLRCDGLYKLSIANYFRDKIFWFPHSVDFRGRAYPCPPHFNHLGGDMSRSILLFAKGEPLGRNGLDWLKIHLINLTGLKKQETIQERLECANQLMAEIIDSADNPLNGRKWWAKSDEPWQTLACCKEITNVIRSPDPEKYICHFPVHQDGSCNGLQHYAALGRDEHGAKQVNLCPMDKPQDVYTGVAKIVEMKRAKDAECGIEIAKVLEGFITRKVIKQTVMTTVYGVTRYGARQQILKQLKDLPEFPQEKAWTASMYLTQKTFQSLQQMFTATKEIQEWLTEIAVLISQVCGQPMEWVTPLGLPVIQPYHLSTRRTMPSLDIGDKHQTESSFTIDISYRPNVMKQKNGFPPNFIHSLDSAHMMLTSLFCRREGITFVSVHDCYWTHPSESIHIMNKICREQFVALHSDPILENLSKFLTQKFSYRDSEFLNDESAVDTAKKRFNKIIQRVPTTGNFNLKNVLQSTYFFS